MDCNVSSFTEKSSSLFVLSASLISDVFFPFQFCVPAVSPSIVLSKLEVTKGS